MTVDTTQGSSRFSVGRPFGFTIAGALLLALVWIPMLVDPRAYRDGDWHCGFEVPWRVRWEGHLVTAIADALLIWGALLLFRSWRQVRREH